MRRIASLLTIALVSVASRAEAAEHGMRINEILLSANGDTDIQYVELRDTIGGGEPFPGDHTLKVYDAAANELGVINLSFPTDANTTDWFVATSEADTFFAPNGDDALTTALPTDGQVCFESVAGKIHCVAWGCITTLVNGPGTSRGASPPDGMSLQRNGSGTFFVGTPTPDANNLSGVPGDFCATDPDAGVTMPPPDASVPDANPEDPPPDANPNGGGGDDDDDGGGGGGGGGCCRVGGGDAGGMMLLALATMMLVRRRRA